MWFSYQEKAVLELQLYNENMWYGYKLFKILCETMFLKCVHITSIKNYNLGELLINKYKASVKKAEYVPEICCAVLPL